ncbi:MAG: class I SAM-dependent rRNA methyltransferase [Candidatus Peribacteraceae bacterium]|jgi:23S rRNA (cytosine1962-C5)-methyltransferase
MEKYPQLTIKPGFEVHLKNRHHAIFKNAVITDPVAKDGDIVEVRSSYGDFLCYATWNSQAYICGRAISFEQGDPLEAIRKNIARAVEMRKSFFAQEDTDCYRLVNAEGDGIPGLIVDRYGDTVVLQLTTLGMDKLRDMLAQTLRDVTGLGKVFEKSSGASRKKEGLENIEGWLTGGGETVEVTERGLKYVIGLLGSQKTGLFLDQREERSLVRSIAKGRTVLDVCSYVGGFSLSALKGGALAADAVDYDAVALERAKEHMEMNGVEADTFTTYAEDAFNFLRRKPMPRPYDFIILDPPAFAKRSADLDPAKKAYTDLNRMAMQALPPGGLLLTCSCSYQMDMELFQTAIFHAARQAKRGAKIIQRHRLAFDHPVNIYHPETEYLKSLLLWIE